MKALISPNENNRVCQIEATEFEVAEPLHWVDCPDNMTTEWTYIDGQFIEPAPAVVVDPVPVDPVQKLKDFLAANPDVAAIITP